MLDTCLITTLNSFKENGMGAAVKMGPKQGLVLRLNHKCSEFKQAFIDENYVAHCFGFCFMFLK